MRKKIKNLQVKLLDKYIANISICERPNGGWASSIRKSLGMSVRQLARNIGISQQSALRLEQNEADYTITLKSLQKIAEGLNCKLVYAFIPNEGSVSATLKKQAKFKATQIVQDVSHTMLLEAQAVDNIDSKINELAEELYKNPNVKLWD